jgi:hypothetical protein
VTHVIGVALVSCVTLVTNTNVMVLVNKCVIGDLLVSDFNKVWWGGVSKSDSKAFGRLLCSRPKAKKETFLKM